MFATKKTMVFACIVLLSAQPPAGAQEVWHAVRNLLPGDIVRSDDVTAQVDTRPVTDAVPATRDVTGLEVKRRVYAGRDLTKRDVGTRTAVKANTTVTVLWTSGDISLELEGRALEDGAVGDEIRVLNPASSRTIRGTVVGDGMVEMKVEQ